MRTTLIAVFTLLGCGYDLPSVIHSCSSKSGIREIEVLSDRAIVRPWASSTEDLLPAKLWQGITPTMSRKAIEAHLAASLRTRQVDWSEFHTPVGRLRWRLDREFSGGDEARIPRIYVYPCKLSLADLLGTDALNCLRKAAPNISTIVFMTTTGDQLATVIVNDLEIVQIIRQQENR
jgi:hypothetical protein